MSLNEYKKSMKNLIDSTDNELLLKHWKKQLEWDVEHENELELSDEELKPVYEGLQEYEIGNTISLEEFISKRK
jgi:hypothetical protein